MITALEIPELNGKEKTAYHFNELEQQLLPILVLADDWLTKDNIVVTKNDEIILEGI